MTKKDPRTMTDEEKLAGLASSGRIQGEEPAPPVEEVPPAKDEKKDETPPTPPVEPTPKEKKPDEAVPPVPKTPEEPANPEAPVVPPPPQEPRNPRNVRHIPIAEHQDMKKEFNSTKEQLAASQLRIKELEELAAKPADAPATEKAIAKFAEKHGFPVEDLKELLAAQQTTSQIPQEFVETMQTLQQEKLQRQEQEYFDTEWKPLEATLKSKYPNATPEQITKAKEAINTAAHTEGFIDKDLDYILFKEDGTISEIFKGAEAPADTAGQPAPRKTVESSRPAGSKPNLSASDFKGRKDFDEFKNMEPSQVNEIIKDFDIKTYQSFISWSARETAKGGLVVTRNGQKVVLK